MTLTEISVIIAAAGAILTPLMGIATAVVLWAVRTAKSELKTEIAAMSMKVDELWAFQLRRGVSEGIEKGLLTKNSPVRITAKARELFSFLADDLRAFYQKGGVYLTDAELAMAIERQFGATIVDKVCIPQGLHAASCLIVAVAIAKGVDELEVL